MKKIILALGVLVLGAGISIALPLYDPFNYSVSANLIGQVSPDNVTWVLAGPGTTTTNQQTIQAGNLSYSGLPASVGNSMKMGGTGGSNARYSFGGIS